MSSTTLMTFLLSTSPNVRSVKLLGSWDNFSKPYIMERDKRVGPGQWRGCHTFTDIICDGSPAHMHPGRSGGLKMGGTYWYYYLLDDDVEHYNEAEPVTSHCPFLPGQPVNVLFVPVILPDSLPTHTREDSIGSQKSDMRTMNPEDKFMNPRQPPKPKPSRLQTSIPLLQQATPPWSFSASPLSVLTNRTASQPSHIASKSKVHDVRAGSGYKTARSVSPPRSRGLRAAFRYLNTSSPDINDTDDEKPISGHRSTKSQGTSREGIRSHSASRLYDGPGQGLYSRWSLETQDTEIILPPRPASSGKHESGSLSIQDRRALKLKSRSSSPRRTPLTLETRPGRDISSNTTLHTKLNEIPAHKSSPFLQPPADESAITGDTTPTPFTVGEKRLPTLPNTPSSVMDEALRDLDAREEALDMEVLASHFSDFSATDESTDENSLYEKSHFSEWSTDNDAISPESMVSASTFNFEFEQEPAEADSMEVPDLQSGLGVAHSDPNTPHLTVNSHPSPATSTTGDSPRMDLPLPHLNVSFSPSDLDIPGLCISGVDDVETNPKRHAAFFGAMESIDALGLSPSPDASALVVPEGVDEAQNGNLAEPGRRHSSFSDAQIAGQSATMQEMMDELSYLKNMIQSGTNLI
ncbi:hypothetical protein ASPWEDRAFT_27549 [Aspergillus wentii DTO 134E9]|uniref:AMP-activated protein kinase glycogen-binding domain-containing protein n=1 Tax=Aspergillus wentii DTO 134E9 TaxID=1073089 RepID=A0A1L9RIU4_ASPWE|nr:uncharacterized protein ASPWEDRAFT_27549 [Aspergillus wentii DTO 134E9]OJJ34856.1 hypothetical protein ASPWEDRAFT_27549 [Aspergillus wentii DTO 134E9]